MTRTPANSGGQMLTTLREALMPHLKWRQAQLLKTLHERKQSGAYAAASAATTAGRPVLRALVMGGGPIGLRCAVELAMLGHSVLALEQRATFTRLNVLHLWDWVSHDLAELGIKSLDPSVFASGDYVHVGTSQLQHSLLKIALLLGVQVRLGAQVSDLADLKAVEPSKRRSLDWPADERGAGGAPLALEGLPSPGKAETSSPKARSCAKRSRLSFIMVDDAEQAGNGDDFGPSDMLGLSPAYRKDGAHEAAEIDDAASAFSADVLVDATGARCGLFTAIGFEQVTALKSARALGVVCHFYNRKTAEENALSEGSWAQQYYTARFAKLKERGVNLQNLVYYRSTGAFSSAATHYFVMTADADSLNAMGALHSLEVPEAQLCASKNVDRAKLQDYVRLAVGEFVPELQHAELVEAQGVQIFDFSERKVSNRASVIVNAEELGGVAGQQVLVTRVGDALQEPFWPEGLGINRGFLGALDAADLAHRAMPLLLRPLGAGPATVDDFAALLRRREEIYGLTKRLSGSNRQKELKPHLDAQRRYSYSLNPATRYAGWNKLDLAASSPRGGKPKMAFHTGWMTAPSVAARAKS